MSKVEDFLVAITGAFTLGAICGFLVSVSIYEKPAPAEVKSSAPHPTFSTTTDTFAPIVGETTPYHLPPGFYFEHDQANNRYRYCERPSSCDIFGYETKEAAAQSAWNWIRYRDREAKAKWEKVKP